MKLTPFTLILISILLLSTSCGTSKTETVGMGSQAVTTTSKAASEVPSSSKVASTIPATSVVEVVLTQSEEYVLREDFQKVVELLSALITGIGNNVNEINADLVDLEFELNRLEREVGYLDDDMNSICQKFAITGTGTIEGSFENNYTRSSVDIDLDCFSWGY